MLGLGYVLAAPTPAPVPPDPEVRGCCSHHHGVCGCSGHTIVCCDNSFSPSCGC
jgi:hypothetical protein